MKIIFAGTPEFAASHLEAIIQQGQHELVAVYSQPDRRSGRGKKVQPTPVKAVAEAAGIPVFQPLSLKDADEQAQLRQLNADLMVVVAYGMLLPTEVLAIPNYACINVHASLLPRWRGAAPIERALEAGDKQTGITIMHMDVGLDTGDMLSKVTLAIQADDTGDSLRQKMQPLGCDALLEALNTFEQQNGQWQGEKQDDTLANYARKLNKEEACIDWQASAETLALKIRAFNDANPCYSFIDGQRTKIWQAEVITTNSEQPPGTIISASKEGIVVSCGQGQLSLQEQQLPGAKRLGCQSLLNARKALLAPGQHFESQA